MISKLKNMIMTGTPVCELRLPISMLFAAKQGYYSIIYEIPDNTVELTKNEKQCASVLFSIL